jgi:hypothetical protein
MAKKNLVYVKSTIDPMPVAKAPSENLRAYLSNKALID